MGHRLWILAFVLLALAGCQHAQTRAQSEDEGERDKNGDVETVGDATDVGNAEPIPVSGVGLVVDLDGTGGSPPPGGFRGILEKELQTHGDNPKEVLASPNNAMVMVSALIPPGAHKGDPIDVEITLPPQSRTTSLRGGHLRECLLYNYDSTGNIAKSFNLNYQGANALKIGHVLAKAEGRVLVGFGDGDEGARLKQGRVWGGGRCYIDRPFYLVLKKGRQRGVVTQKAAERVNETFHGPYRGAPTDLAVAEPDVVFLKVPQQYRPNLPHFLRVVRLIPLGEAPAAGGPYRQRLEQQLLDPAHAVTAALRLEALGGDSVDALQKGLKSSHPLVRFCAAESLAYLGSKTCAEELARLAAQQPVLRSYCLTALASLDESITRSKLAELLAVPDQETRYGAFRALRALDEHDPVTRGELINNSFWLHRVVPDAPALVHLTCSRRAEVVLFGHEPCLVPPFSFRAGEFTVTAGRDDDRCTISRFSVNHGTRQEQCPLKLDDVLRTLAELDGAYPDVVDLLRQAGTCHSLTCPVAVDALPQEASVFELAKRGAADPEFLKTDQEILNARDDFGATPTLFDRGAARRSPPLFPKDPETPPQDRKAGDDRKTAER
jgi:hypothetical protein